MVKASLDRDGEPGSGDDTVTSWDKVCMAKFVEGYQFHTQDGDQGANALSDLASASLTCTVGEYNSANGGQVTTVYTGANYCGYLFSGDSYYFLWSGSTAYQGGDCSVAQAGRSWVNGGNYGCNLSKVFVR
jgi:hypothetical protein